jgi:hypothetical protein
LQKDLVYPNLFLSLHPNQKQITMNIQEVEVAKAVLRENGFFVDNLWCVDDVKLRYNCDDEQAQGILNDALTNDATMEQIWLAIDMAAENEGLELKDYEK